MNRKKISYYFFLVLIGMVSTLAPLKGLAQTEDLTTEQILTAARDTMIASKMCFLITLDETGQPRTRIMDPFDPEPNMSVWFGTNRQTRKIKQIQNDSRVTLAYYDHQGLGYVTMTGVARLEMDPEKRQKKWKDDWKRYYPEGPGSSAFVAIEFIPSDMEIMSVSRKIFNGIFKPVRLIRKGSEWVRQE